MRNAYEVLWIVFFGILMCVVLYVACNKHDVTSQKTSHHKVLVGKAGGCRNECGHRRNDNVEFDLPGVLSSDS